MADDATAARLRPEFDGGGGFFSTGLEQADPEIYATVRDELGRQQNRIELIASENIVSRAVLETQGTVLTNKYAEGYPGKRYYAGCEFVDVAEALAIERAKRLFGCAFANVQPHSGAQANGAVMLALLRPGDTILGMDLAAGGHLTHGARPALSGKWFNAGAVRRPARRRADRLRRGRASGRGAPAEDGHRRGVGLPAGDRLRPLPRHRDSVGAYLFVDMAHIAGIVAAGLHPSPLPHAHVVTTTTHKTLRGPRGGMILTNDLEIGKKINSAVFPGLQGGPLMHVIAAKAVAFGEALRPDYKFYMQPVLENARALASVMVERGCDVVTGGTDNHLMLVDLRPKGVKGNAAERSLERAGITCNKNGVPFDPEKPGITSGVRLGTPASTTRGFGIAEFQTVGHLISDVLDGLARHGDGQPSGRGRGRCSGAGAMQTLLGLRLSGTMVEARVLSDARLLPRDVRRS
jgi:glycine hydroxymethyltransferase